MLFSSSAFILAFLPIALLVYYLCPNRFLKNLALLAASLFFYAWGDPSNLILLLFAIACNWFVAKLLVNVRQKSGRGIVLGIIVTCNLLLLGFYKYENFLAENINALLGSAAVPLLSLSMPVGISYFTLKMITYAVDLYRGQAKEQRSILNFALYISMFPAMVAGPIVRYEMIEDQLMGRHESLEQFASGARLFSIGLGKKVLLSNTVAILADSMLAAGGPAIGAVGAWGGLFAYSMQLYFDFSGYSDMAIGLAKMFGFHLEKNFNYPYIAKSVTEFWRRWHISLSSFFRDYIYIPLGGSRVGAARQVFNTGVVWLITGIWHGAAWNFIFWGLFYFAAILIEKFVLNSILTKAPSFLQHLYTIFVFMIAWALFWIGDLNQLIPYLFALFGGYGLTGTKTFWELQVWSYLPVFMFCIIASTPVVPWLKTNLVAWVEGQPIPRHAEGIGKKDLATDKLCNSRAMSARGSKGRQATASVVLILADLTLLLILVTSIFSIVAGSFSPLIYFKF